MPHDLEAAILIVLHTANRARSFLPQILQRAGKLPVRHPADGEAIERGQVYVAPPGFHMIIESGIVRVVQGPRENLHRPAIDPLFRSAAASYGRRVIGIILTGMGAKTLERPAERAALLSDSHGTRDRAARLPGSAPLSNQSWQIRV
jgi:two-component system, chemotaxis family, protein-glutamate methylesterase/glutaminase